MVRKHAKREVVARGKLQPMYREEDNQPVDLRLLDLYLDEDGVYRWYEQDKAFEVEGKTLREATTAASKQWPTFQLYEVQGRAYDNSKPLPDAYAADELAAVRGA